MQHFKGTHNFHNFTSRRLVQVERGKSIALKYVTLYADIALPPAVATATIAPSFSVCNKQCTRC